MTLLSVKLSKPFCYALIAIVSMATFAVALYGPFAARHAAVSGEVPLRLGEGLYKVAKPLVISTAPVILVESGALNFETGKGAKKSSFISGILPAGWAQYFLREGLEAAALLNGHVTLDLRSPGAQDGARIGKPEEAISRRLEKSGISTVTLDDCALKILRDGASPLTLHVRAGRFDIDLADGEFEGKGVVTIDGRPTNFTLSSDYSGVSDDGASLFDTRVNLDNDHFKGSFDGVFSGAAGLRLSGRTQVEFKDEAARGLLFDVPAFEGGAASDKRAGKHADGEKAATTNHAAYFASAAGQLEWAGNQGTLADGQFKFGESPATGTLSLNLEGGVQAVSGTLAFAQLDLSPLFEADPDDEGASAPNPALADAAANEKAAALPLRDSKLHRMLQTLSPLIRNFDADLRISADMIVAGPLNLRESGFSLFQKKGEVILDLAETMVFDGTASGHVKIDTNYPKPRWHVNMGLKGAALGDISALIKREDALSGRGNVKVHLTSFGDKVNEIYHNMYGAILLSVPDGGQIGLDLGNLLTAQENRSETELTSLLSGRSDFESLEGTGHFARGAVVADHFSLKTKTNQFTGGGRLTLFDRLVDWNIASWPLTAALENEAASNSDSNAGLSGGDVASPVLLVCSEISGSWRAPKFEKYTALHLALLRRGCPAAFTAPKMKTNTRKIAPVGNAG